MEVMWIHIVKFPHVQIYTLDEALWYPSPVLFITDQHKASQNHAVTIASDFKCIFYLDLE